MQATLYKASNENINIAKQLIEAGELVILPTDTAYALSGDICNPKAVAAIYNAKRRPSNKFFPMLVNKLDMAKDYTHLSELDISIINQFWPGALTLILSVKNHHLAANAYNGHSIATRAPAHLFTLEVIKALGRPIVGTSANISNEANLTGSQLQVVFGEEVSAIFIDSEEKEPISSTIISTHNGKIELIRQGCLQIKEFAPWLTAN